MLTASASLQDELLTSSQGTLAVEGSTVGNSSAKRFSNVARRHLTMENGNSANGKLGRKYELASRSGYRSWSSNSSLAIMGNMAGSTPCFDSSQVGKGTTEYV